MSLVLGLLTAITSIPIFFKVSSIPIVDSYLVTGFGYWNAFLSELPFLQVVWQCFILYIGFKMSLMIVKFFFGHRITL